MESDAGPFRRARATKLNVENGDQELGRLFDSNTISAKNRNGEQLRKAAIDDA